jgi:glycosyltransferase involved in cell wall biosynthesis
LKTYWPSPNHIAAAWNMLRRIRTLRQAIRVSRPEVIISFCQSTNVMTLLATRGLSMPIIVSEHNDPAQPILRKEWTYLRRWTYPWASKITVLSASYVNYFPLQVQRNCTVVPNPIVMPNKIADDRITSNEQGTKNIIAMGTIIEQKGFDNLLKAFSLIAEKYSDWHLTIWGEGPERARLVSLCNEAGLEQRIHLPGLTNQPFEKMKQADLFVLSSRFEGFPMVLCEAMACGLPVISFDCSAGIRDIIRDGVDGVLVPSEDVHALAGAMRTLMRAPQERQRLASHAPEILDRFGLEKVMSIWDQLLSEVRL